MVEAQLRAGGIPLQSEPQPANGSANLIILIDTVKHPQGAFLCDVQVSFLQEVHLSRRQDPEPFPAQTLAYGDFSVERESDFAGGSRAGGVTRITEAGAVGHRRPGAIRP